MSETESPDLQTSYTLKGKGEILEKLRMLEKSKTLLTALPQGASTGFLTTIIKVLPEKGFLALDTSVNESLNARLLKAEKVSVSGQIEGISTRFAVSNITDATLNGLSVLAAPIPDALYWLQRRGYYRLPVPYALNAKCQIQLPSGEPATFDLINVSLTGLAVLDRSSLLDESLEVGHRFANCELLLPAFSDESFELELRNKISIPSADGRKTYLRAGCKFHGVNRGFEVHMQKFMYELEIQKKRADSMVRGL